MKCKGREELGSFSYLQKPVNKVMNLTCTVDNRAKVTKHVLEDINYLPEKKLFILTYIL